MNTTMIKPRAETPVEHWTVTLPEALQLVTGKSPIVVLPPKFAGEPETVCVCGGLLVNVRGGWRHTDACSACRTDVARAKPCTGRHVGCSKPEPEQCEGGCGQPVTLTEGKACDGCFNLEEDRPDLDRRDLR